MTPTAHHVDWRRVAWIGFLLHSPGLYLFGYRDCIPSVPFNILAIVLTILAAASAAAVGAYALAIFFWLSGHFGWSLFLAAHVRRKLRSR